jgi:hypothetical protein
LQSKQKSERKDLPAAPLKHAGLRPGAWGLGPSLRTGCIVSRSRLGPRP